ncbi:hypothetical protein WJX81_001027 [Elliptochloris bilobata]|uniref:non-specific serine/threonine protein kinase n=1 Tax=Elliptochloris bilobata TaxID=381761 RepID=A0AAW1RMY5_9CHLO
MRSLLRSVVQRKEGGLVGRTIKVGPYTCKVDAHLGDGGFATIYRVRDNSGGAAYALKHIRLAGEVDARAECDTEVETMKQLRGHPNILTLRAVAYAGPKGADQEAFLLLDLCRDSLVNYMQERSGQLSNGDVFTIFHSIAKAVAVMHHQSPPLAHRDLKAENILLHNNGTWVLCDFGSASSWSGSYDTTDAVLVAEEHIRKHTTPAYRAPEMFDLYSRVPISTSADLWQQALGVLLYFLCYGRLPFGGDCKLQVLNGEFSVPPGRPTQFEELIRGLLTMNPGARTTINDPAGSPVAQRSCPGSRLCQPWEP